MIDRHFSEEQRSHQIGSVAEFLGHNRAFIDDFAQYMLGRDRRTFHLSCNLRRDQALDIFDECWNVYYDWMAWQHWRLDLCTTHDS